MPSTTWPVEFRTPESARLADLKGIDFDLEFTIRACQKLEELEFKGPDDLLNGEALSTAALVRYGRCFAKGVRWRIPREIVAGLPEHLQEYHELFIEFRDKHVAHSVNPFEHNQVVVWVSDHPGEKEVQSISVRHSRVSVLGAENARQLRELAQVLREELQLIAEAEQSRLLELVRSLPYSDFRSRDMIKPFDPSLKDVGRRR